MTLKLRLNYLLKPYWKTLRHFDKTRKWFNKGMSVCAVLTTRCNLTCEECPMFMYDKPVRYEESTFEEWKVFFERFPYWCSQVYLSGGETTLYPDLVPLANWLIERGHHVCIFSNLWNPEAFRGLKDHHRLVVYATYHTCDDWERFNKACKTVGEIVRVLPREFEDTGTHSIKQSPKFTMDWFLNTDSTPHLPPDAPRSLKMFIGCTQLYRK